ncbi:DUF4352 domain-containing protein [Streptomyces sp. NPDC059165]|uniref:DUF4352 domain-containing protein n=1 Tax=Streptomyces sp. NPDC059165 TaxID=3346751 RepID=UPI0036B6DA5A
MRRTAMAATAATILLTLTGCLSTPEVTTEPKPADSASAAPTDDKTPAVAEPREAKVGDTITVKGMQDGEQLEVTVKKIVDPAKPADEFFSPEDGKRWIGVQFQLVNTGSKPYDDSPSNGVQIADTEGQRFGTVFGEIKSGPSMAASVTLPPGEKALGWIVLELPKASKAATVQFSMNSGFSNQTGQWKLQ